MKYYKVIKDDKVIDVLNDSEICYLVYNQKHKRMFNAKRINDAQAIFSSDQRCIWHLNTLLPIPVEGYDTVELISIDEYEYKQLKCLNCKTPEQILEEYTLLLLEGGIL